MKKLLVLSLVLTVALAWAAPPLAQAADYKPEYKMSLVLGTAFPWGKGGEDLGRPGAPAGPTGRINIKLYPGPHPGPGGPDPRTLSDPSGRHRYGNRVDDQWSPQVKELNLFSMPFLMPDFPAIDALTQGEVGKDLFAILDKGGVCRLAWGRTVSARCPIPNRRSKNRKTSKA